MITNDQGAIFIECCKFQQDLSVYRDAGNLIEGNPFLLAAVLNSFSGVVLWESYLTTRQLHQYNIKVKMIN